MRVLRRLVTYRGWTGDSGLFPLALDGPWPGADPLPPPVSYEMCESKEAATPNTTVVSGTGCRHGAVVQGI
jgi:hypothetical protein